MSLTYMVPLGIASAAAVRVGQALGRGDPHGASRAGWTAMALGMGFMFCMGVIFFLIPDYIVRVYTPDPVVIHAAGVLLYVAAFFQLFDGMQTVATGALRGAGDTRTPMLCHLLLYWGIGLPLGAYLCFRLALGRAGFVDRALRGADFDWERAALFLAAQRAVVCDDGIRASKRARGASSSRVLAKQRTGHSAHSRQDG